MTYLVDDLLPTGEVNLIAGPSGSGKTTLALQCLKSFTKGELVLGKASHPAPVAYISCDRSRASVERTFSRIGIPTDSFPILALRGSSVPRSIGGITNWVATTHPSTKLLLIEAIASLVPEGKINDYAIVAKFLTDLGNWCEKLDLSIWGSTHAAKVKENERYKNPRQRILGTVAWGGFSETVVTIEPMEPDNVDDQRRIVLVEPREAQPFSLQMQFDPAGRLVTLEEAAEVVSSDFLDRELLKLPHNTEIKTSTFQELGRNLGLSVITVKRWIDSAIGRNLIQKVSRGNYLRVQIQ